MKELSLQRFLKSYNTVFHNEKWIDTLTKDPYNIKVMGKGERVLFKYNQIASDFNKTLVQECRGIILWKDNWDKIVCHPLHKFFNYGEQNAAELDWESTVVLEKMDGSLIKVYWWDGEWRVATNGTIEACDAELQFPAESKGLYTFDDLFHYTLSEYTADSEGDFFSQLDKEYTYLFELCTPYNRVVVPHTECKLYYITAKKNDAEGEEIRENHTIVDTIREYKMNSYDDAIKMAQLLPYDNEGYVLVDKYNNRVKVKSPAYLAVHRLKGEDVPSKRKIFDLILMGEEGEFLSYFPEYTEEFERIKKGWEIIQEKVRMDIKFLAMGTEFNTRKEFAMVAKEAVFPGLMFQLYDGKEITITEYVQNMSQKSKDTLLKDMED